MSQNLIRFHVEPKGDGVELTIEIEGSEVITASASLEQVEEIIDALEDTLEAEVEDEDEDNKDDEGEYDGEDEDEFEDDEDEDTVADKG